MFGKADRKIFVLKVLYYLTFKNRDIARYLNFLKLKRVMDSPLEEKIPLVWEELELIDEVVNDVPVALAVLHNSLDELSDSELKKCSDEYLILSLKMAQKVLSKFGSEDKQVFAQLQSAEDLSFFYYKTIFVLGCVLNVYGSLYYKRQCYLEGVCQVCTEEINKIDDPSSFAYLTETVKDASPAYKNKEEDSEILENIACAYTSFCIKGIKSRT